MHRINAAERAIRTYKNHFLAGLATCDSMVPITEWDRLIPAANITLNLLQTSRVNPKLSSYTYINRQFGFNATPLCQPGTNCIIHAKPINRESWQYHGQDAWTIGPSLKHYRCIKCFIPSTCAEVNIDTLTLIPQKIFLPQATLNDHIRHVSSKQLHLLTTHSPLPGLKILPSTHNALKYLQQIYQSSTDNKNMNNYNNATMVIGPSSNKKSQPFITTTNNQSKRTKQNPSIINQPAIKHYSPIIKGAHQHPTSIYNSKTKVVYCHPLLPPFPFQIPSNPKLPIFNKSFIPKYTPILQDSYHHQTFYPAFYAAKHLQHKVFHIYYHGTKWSLDKLLLGPDKVIWDNALTNELGRTAQGINDIVGSDTLDFIYKNEIPNNRKVTYANFICDFRPLKNDQYRVRMTVGGDKLEYLFESASPAASFLETKILVNSIISNAHEGVRFFTLDIKDFFLQSIMVTLEFMRIHSKYFTPTICQKYNITAKIASDGYVYCKIKRGMYGLMQAARLAHDLLKTRLAPFGYFPDKICPNIWRHKRRKTAFILCVDDFGIKYYTKQDANHLITSVKSHYDVTIDWTGENYCGLQIKLNYVQQYVDISMPKYTIEFLARQKHPQPLIPQHDPHKWTVPSYGTKIQYAKLQDDSPKLDKKDTTNIQSIAGSVLYYGRAVDYTILPANNELSRSQASPSLLTKDKSTMLLDYLHTHPTATLCFHASKMILHIDSDAAYLVAPNAKSRIAGYFYLGDGTTETKLNTAIHVECYLLNHVVSSAVEAETSGGFHNCQFGIYVRRLLNLLNHPQPPTLVKSDNATTESFINTAIKQKRSKSWDMRFHWIRDQEAQQQFKVYWDRARNNYADYFTKHHATSHHKNMRPIYLQVNSLVNMINLLSQIDI